MAWIGTDVWTGTDLIADAIAPTPIAFTVTAVSPSQINLSWAAIPVASGYDVEKDGAVVVYNQSATTYSDTGLLPGSTHNYRVRAVE